jgi:hypothetical protein
MQMSETVEIITQEEYKEDDDGKPDIAVIFSHDPNSDKIELEKNVREEDKELYFTGKMFYKSTDAITQLQPEIRLPLGIYASL